MIICYDFSLESQTLLMIKDLFKLKIDLNFSNLIFSTTKLICIFIKYRSDFFLAHKNEGKLHFTHLWFGPF